MNTKLLCNPKEIRRFLSQACVDVYDSLIQGSLVAQEYFETRQRPINSYLAACITRFEAKEFLLRKRNLLTPYLIENANNNGIAIVQDLYSIRVLKGLNGKPPCPSKAKRSERFYNQSMSRQYLLFKDAFIGWTSSDWDLYAASADRLNLILCWEVDESYSVNRLQLVAPRQAWKYQESVKLFWREPVPHPAFGISIPDLNVVNEEPEDLEISFDVKAESGDDDDD